MLSQSRVGQKKKKTEQWIRSEQWISLKALITTRLERIAHLDSRFVCNTGVIVNANSSPPVSRVKFDVTKTYYHIIK